MAIIYNAIFDKNTRKLSFEDKAGNEIYSFTVPERTPVDDINKPLTFKATQDGSSVKLTKSGSPTGSFQTSNDGGNTWADYTIDDVIDLNTGDEVSFRAKADRTSEQSDKNYFKFEMTGKIEAWHNVMSLYRTNDFSTFNAPVSYAFSHLFYGCTSLVKSPVLPATTLSAYCYWAMFFGCTSLKSAPALPATTLVDNCYASMFNGCTSLTKAPALPVTTLARYCYNYMFKGCTSLVNAPALPATTLANGCYQYMFHGCTSLTESPELPATTLYNSCYSYMFQGCTSLTKAPVLPATTLDSYCYWEMFDGCSSLNEVHCKVPSSYSSSQISSYANNWLRNVSSTGTFYTNADANWPSGASGIPTGWTRVNEVAPTVDDITKPLTFKATQDGSTVTLTKVTLNTTVKLYVSFQTSRDGGNTWEAYTLGTAITLNTGDEVSFRTLSDRTSTQSHQSGEKYLRFEMTGKIEAWHNVMSLYRTSDFATYDPTTAIGNYWFYELFASCTSLTKAPALPATTLADSCYSTMFAGCTSLKEAPELPATYCYNRCYHSMFNGCTSLTKTPDLQATTLAQRCYWLMFRGCSSLNEVRCQIPSSYSVEDIPKYTGSGAYEAWLNGVSSTGTFYTNADANWPSGAGGIPENWSRVNI